MHLLDLLQKRSPAPGLAMAVADRGGAQQQTQSFTPGDVITLSCEKQVMLAARLLSHRCNCPLATGLTLARLLGVRDAG